MKLSKFDVGEKLLYIVLFSRGSYFLHGYSWRYSFSSFVRMRHASTGGKKNFARRVSREENRRNHFSENRPGKETEKRQTHVIRSYGSSARAPFIPTRPATRKRKKPLPWTSPFNDSQPFSKQLQIYNTRYY